ncbi:MAG: hypothetical protein ACK59M_06900 [Pseudomonadota bacterium]|jgi:hypothetical protein
MSTLKLSYVVASDVSQRDGIGIEVYLDGELILELFRDDTRHTREVTAYRRDIPLEIVEQAIARFKKEIPWDFIADD